MPFWKSNKNSTAGGPVVPDSTIERATSIPTSLQAAGSFDGRSHTSSTSSSLGTKGERLGLFVIEDQDEDDEDAIDIVALHGLNGHWEKTWQATANQVIWLRDFLPQQIPHARIMSFGYDSILQFSKSVADIGTFAEQLLEDLMSRRSGASSRRPIIFICHSLGGIVAKKAIIRAHEKERYKSLLDSVRGILFFGTPHRGSALAGWSTLLSNVAVAASFGTKTNKGLSKDLQSQSFALQEISKSFVDRAKKLQIVSFYETDKMDFLNCRVVAEESAILGLPNEVTIAISGNHRTMCRFQSINEQRYRYVWTNLQNMAGAASKEKLVDQRIPRSLDTKKDYKDASTGSASLRTTREDETNKSSNTIQKDNTSKKPNMKHNPALTNKIEPGSIAAYSTFGPQKKAPVILGEQAVTGADQQHQGPDYLLKDRQGGQMQSALGERNVRKEAKSGKGEKDGEEFAKEALAKAKKDCFRDLGSSDYEAHRLRNPVAVPGTCQWLLHHEIYCDWRQKQGSDLLWLSADPGCGKSVLASYLVGHLKNKDNLLQVPEIVCFFFFKEDNSEQDNAISALQALLHQLYSAQPWLLEHAAKRYLAEGARKTLGQFGVLWSIFEASVKDPRSRDTLLVLDGLDECESATRSQLLQSLMRFYTTEDNKIKEGPYIKTIVASRPDNDIKMAFDMRPIIRLRGEDEPEAISIDVELVIQDHIEKAVLRGLPRSILDDLKAGLIKGADRTFLWTTMVIDLLEAKRGASKKELLEILHSRDIYRIYHRLLEDSSDQEQARKLLHIVVAAFRPLTLAEMSIAMAVNPTQLTFENLEEDVVHNYEERVKDLCGNFIRIVRGTIYLVHQTARQFLLQNIKGQPLQFGKWQHSMFLADAHSQLLDICLLYLALLDSRSFDLNHNLESDLGPAQFLDYAGRFWTIHYREIQPGLNPGQLARCAKLCSPNSPGFKRWFQYASANAHNPNQGLNEGTIQQDIALYFGLDEVVVLMERLKPQGVAWIDENSTWLSEPQDQNGSLIIRKSLTLRNPNDIVQPHTVSPGHWGTSPLDVAMASRASLDANLQSKLTDHIDGA